MPKLEDRAKSSYFNYVSAVKELKAVSRQDKTYIPPEEEWGNTAKYNKLLCFVYHSDKINCLVR